LILWQNAIVENGIATKLWQTGLWIFEIATNGFATEWNRGFIYIGTLGVIQSKSVFNIFFLSSMILDLIAT